MSAKYRYLSIIAPLGVLLDQLTKQWVVSHLSLRAPGVELVPGVLNIIRVHNSGIVFGVSLGGRVWVYLIISLIAFGVIGYMLYTLHPRQRMLSAALALVLSGAVGNLIDRLRFGYVIDMIDVHWFDRWHWFTFNVADVAICVGAGLMLLDMLLGDPAKFEAETNDKPERGEDGPKQTADAAKHP